MHRTLFITSEEVASLLELSGRASFLVKRDWLERDHDFPPPMPHSLSPMLWRRSAVLAWLDRQGLVEEERPAPPPRTRLDHLMQKAGSA
ncbi:hypothetical protein [Pseudooceanicola algae]|uniref:Prophage CP4-57 regulatory protein n=1 Tax=Pseudooceanicola algae TaxID=1537215 RepID=A0A418SK95_9RHOB|nr:hypothetical protein [Pseudooceanicola algae]QPM89131.1 hypothetical protein PSAL_003420 [Pseudooceanicola algae]